MQKKFGIIFDVDGTMWDSTEILTDSWNRIMEAEGVPGTLTPDLLKQEFGKPLDVIGDDLMPDVQAEKRDRILEQWILAEAEDIRARTPHIYEGLEETLKGLSEKYPLFIVSNSQKGYIESFLEVTGFGSYFQDHVCNGDTDLEKDGNIRLIMERNGLTDAVYVGDTLGDYEKTKQAGIAFAWAGYGFGKAPDCDYLVTEPKDLLKFFG